MGSTKRRQKWWFGPFFWKSYINLKIEGSNKYYINATYGVIKPSDIHPPFVLGLRPMPRSRILYEEDSGNHYDPENCAEDNAVLG